LRELRPTDNLRKAIHSGLSKLPKDYSAIHIRNTDLKADMSGISETLESIGNSPILICSDDLKMVDKLNMEFPSFKFISLSNSVSYRNIINMTLHKNNPELPRSELNTMMFIELIAMATASNFYAVPLIGNPIKSISGFSELVMGLRENDIILKMFLQ
jgi:hypothetical protein